MEHKIYFYIFVSIVFVIGFVLTVLSHVRAWQQRKHTKEAQEYNLEREIEEYEKKPSGWFKQLFAGKNWLYELEVARIYEYLKKKVNWDIANWEANIANNHQTPLYGVISICSNALVIMGLLGTLYAIREGVAKFDGDLSSLKNAVSLAVITSLIGIFSGAFLLLIAATARQHWENTLDSLKGKVKASLSYQPPEPHTGLGNVNDELREILNNLQTNINDMLNQWQITFDNALRDTNELIQKFSDSLNRYETVTTSNQSTNRVLLRDIQDLQVTINTRCSQLAQHEQEFLSILRELNQILQQRSNEPTQQDQEG